jgi:hypothetical protein
VPSFTPRLHRRPCLRVGTTDEGIEEFVFCDNTLLDSPDTDTIIAAVYPAWLVVPGHEVIKAGSIQLFSQIVLNVFRYYAYGFSDKN